MFERRALQAIALGRLDPMRAGLSNCDALAVRCMSPLADGDDDRGVIGVGGLLLLESLDVSLAALVDVLRHERCLPNLRPIRHHRLGPLYGPLAET
jgi:hypothetical protein